MGRFSGMAGSVLIASALSGVASASEFTDEFMAALASGQVAVAEDLARAESLRGPTDGTALFALGAARFLGSLEELLNGLYGYGLAGRVENPMLMMAGLPFLRLPVPDNPDPDQVSYAGLRQVLERFGDDLSEAEGILARVEADDVDLPLDLARIHLDVDRNGSATVDESLAAILAAVSGGVALSVDAGLQVDADAADAAWLRAYTHLLSALTDLILAHDWEATFDATFHGVFPNSFPSEGGISASDRALRERLAKLESEWPPEPECDPQVDRTDTECRQAWMDFYAQPSIAETQRASAKLMHGSIADLVAFVHLLRWPVVEPDRMASSLGHLNAMIGSSRETWRRILAETDDGREWIPGPEQTGVLAGLPIDQPRVDAWLAVLDETEAVLRGEKLVPHPRLDGGMNLRRLFLEPRTMDLVLLIQGSAALPYLERGPISDAAAWRALTGTFGGDAFAYFVWLN